MIQFRWRRLTSQEEVDQHSVVEVDNYPCVLEYRQHFMPTSTMGGNGMQMITLAHARGCDKEWKPVRIDHE